MKGKIAILLTAFVFIANDSICQNLHTRNGYPRVGRDWSRSLAYPYLSHPFYEFLEREETKSPIALFSRTRPYMRSGMLANGDRVPADTSIFSGEVGRHDEENRARIAAATGLCHHYSGAWQRKIRLFFGDNKFSRTFFDDGTHFLRFCLAPAPGVGFAATIQPIYGLEYIDTDDERGTISRFTSGARFEGGYAGKLRFMVDFRDHTEAGNGPYLTREQLYEDRWASVDQKGNSSTTYDISESFVQYYGRDLSFTAGRGRHQWGPGQFGSLFLNANNPPFDYVRFDAVLEDEQTPRAIYYTFLHGFLESRLPAETLYVTPEGRLRTINAEKYLSAQRLEVRPRANMLLGFSQAVVYGDRGLQLGYLTPLNFLYSVQHSSDDKDNFILGVDATWRVVRGLKLYGEAFFDDIIVGELTESTGSNKSAYTIGAQGIIPKPFWSKFDLKAEYTKIRPFVYTHFFTVNAYSHWYSPLGYTREPNSEFLTAELRGTFYPVQITLHASHENHGANTPTWNVGGDIFAANQQGNLAIFPFLAGKLERTMRMGLRARWEVLPNLFIFGEGMNIQRTDEADRFESRGGFAWNL